MRASSASWLARPPPGPGDDNGFGFVLTMPDKTLYLSSTSEEDAQGWIAAVTSAGARRL